MLKAIPPETAGQSIPDPATNKATTPPTSAGNDATCEICKKNFTRVDNEHVCSKCKAIYDSKKTWLEFFSEIVPWLVIILPLLGDALFGTVNWEFFARVALSSFIATIVIYLKRRFSVQEGEAEKKVVALQNELDKEKLRNEFAESAKNNAVNLLVQAKIAQLTK